MNKRVLLGFSILPVLFLAACGREAGTATPPALAATSAKETPAGGPRLTENLPAAPVAPVPTGQTGGPGARATATPPATATPLPTRTATPSLTPLPSVTPTPLPEINVLIAACDTGIDLFNRLGEVTNAYVQVQNVGAVDAQAVQVTLEGSDEEKGHPDKSYRLEHLPAGYEIALKMTVDTKNGEDTSIRVTVTSEEGVSSFAIKDSCRSRRPDRAILEKLGELFEVRDIDELAP
jgi:hypothetical protein